MGEHPVSVRSPARFGPAHPVQDPVGPGYRPTIPGAQPEFALVPSGRDPVSSEARPVKTRSLLRLETGRSGHQPGLTGLCAGQSGAKSGRPGSSRKLMICQVSNGQISGDTINTPSSTSERVGTTLQVVLELSLSYSIVRNTKSLRSPSSSTQTQIPPGKR